LEDRIKADAPALSTSPQIEQHEKRGARLPLLSVIIPAYNEEESISHVLPALQKVLGPENINFELIFIDDGSTDSTFQKIVEQNKAHKNIHGYRFSRNFGKEAAIWAGLEAARGDCCVVMDCDLQHPPDTLPKMYKLWEEGYEIVEGVKAHRGKQSRLYNVFSAVFYRLIATLSGLDMRASSDFKLLDKRVIGQLTQLGERNTFFRGLSYWVGFRSVKMEYEVAPRQHGTTKWNFFKLFKKWDK
jgi:dolichol-phosphate mannosyltransferase